MNLFNAIFAEGRENQKAIVCDDRELTYQELRSEMLRVARLLYAIGVAKDERVGILLNDSPEFVASFLAIQGLGAIAVPINLALGRDEQRTILRDCTAQTVIAEAKICNELLT